MKNNIVGSCDKIISHLTKQIKTRSGNPKKLQYCLKIANHLKNVHEHFVLRYKNETITIVSYQGDHQYSFFKTEIDLEDPHMLYGFCYEKFGNTIIYYEELDISLIDHVRDIDYGSKYKLFILGSYYSLQKSYTAEKVMPIVNQCMIDYLKQFAHDPKYNFIAAHPCDEALQKFLDQHEESRLFV